MTQQLAIQSMTGTVHLLRVWKGRNIPACASTTTRVSVFPIDKMDEGDKLCKRCAAKMH